MSQLIRANEHLAMNRAFGVQELSDVLEKAMQRETKYTVKQSFAPSGLGYKGQCARYWYYAFNGADFVSDTAATAQSNMDAGTDAGKRLANLFKQADMLIDDEIPARHNDPDVFGYIDALVRWKGEPVVVEIKTTSNAAWNKRMLSNSVPDYQMIQLLIYMYITKHDKGFFFTENKDTNEIFVLPVKMTDEHRQLVENTFEWMREVRKAADEGDLPKRPFTKSSVQCKGCPVRYICWDGWERGSVNGKDPNPGTIDLPILNLTPPERKLETGG